MRVRRGIIVAAALLAIGAVGLDRAFPPDLSRYRLLSLELLDADGDAVNVALAPDGMWRLGARPDQVSPRYLAMLLATEDHRFRWHPGVDPLALTRAAWQLATHGHVVSGGSTLTMQVARLLTPHRHDVAGKLLDIARALQLEAHFTKRQILSMYLTLAPFGGNIEGVRAASLIYFQREPASLTDAEAALLVALPRSPTRLRPDRHAGRALAAEQAVLRRFWPRDRALPTVPAGARRHALARGAPYLAERLHAQHFAGRARTTLDGALQRAVEDLARRERPWLGERGNVAALVVRNADRAVLAYLGGADFAAPSGMVDMVRARRSPGSTLKPFIYGLAIDDSLILPDTLIEDAPNRIGDYAPQNFDRDFHGTITAREALQQSYNLPAVEVLNQVGPRRFAAALREAGATLALPHGTTEPGLPIALGGVGISLEDLTALYVGLADRGEAGALRLIATDPPSRPVPLMTAAAAEAIGDILRGAPLPDGLSPTRARPVAYKTGTSYGFRDAWAVGYSPVYTVAVWVGRNDGTPRPGSFGRLTAAPIMFKLFDLLPPEPDAAPPRKVTPPKIAHLAPSLRRFMPRGPGLLPADFAGPRILFPPANATLDAMPAAGAATPIALEAAGGTPPYRWAINGVPLPPPPLGIHASWLPDGPGYARISVTDRNNRTTSEQIRLH